MTYRGVVKNGVIVLEDGVKLPEGEVVEVQLANAAEEQSPSLYERLKSVVGIAEGLPEDMSENHDHRIHGVAKRNSEP